MVKKILFISSFFSFAFFPSFSAPTSGFFVGLKGGVAISKLKQSIIRGIADDMLTQESEEVDLKVKGTSENSWDCLSETYVGMNLELLLGYSYIMSNGVSLSAALSLSGPSQSNIKKPVEDLILTKVLRDEVKVSIYDKTNFDSFKNVTDVDFLRKERFSLGLLLSLGYFVNDSFEIFAKGGVGFSNSEILASFGGYRFAGTIGKVSSALGKANLSYPPGVIDPKKVRCPQSIKLFFDAEKAFVENLMVYSFGLGARYYLPCHVSFELSYDYKIIPEHNIKFNKYNKSEDVNVFAEEQLVGSDMTYISVDAEQIIPGSLSKIAVCNYGVSSHNINFGISVHF